MNIRFTLPLYDAKVVENGLYVPRLKGTICVPDNIFSKTSE